MSAEARRVAKTEVWVGWESQVVNGVYPLRRFLGGSNHSAVFLTEYTAENLPNAAIKLVPADTMDTEAQLVQWGAAATLSHPHLLRLLDVGRCQLSGRGYLFVVMEYADQTLAQLLPRRALSSDEVTQLLIPTLDVLAALHYNNLVHSQLKPSNFLVVDDQLKLASDTIRSTGYYENGIIRTSPYDPPELSDGDISAPGDVWGLGITLAEALTQHAPAWQDDRFETASLSAALPPEFADTVRRCLTRIPSSRPTVAELKAQYNPPRQAHAISVSAYEPPVVEPPSAPEEPPPARKSSNKGMLWVGVAAALVMLVSGWVSWPIFHRHARAERSSGDISRAESRKGSAGNTSATGTATGEARVTSDDIAVGTAGSSTMVTADDAPAPTARVEAAVTPAARSLGMAGGGAAADSAATAGESAGWPSDSATGEPSGAAAGRPSGASVGKPSGAATGGPSGASVGKPSGAATGGPSGVSVAGLSGAPTAATAGAPTTSPLHTAPLAARGTPRATLSAASVVGSPANPSAAATPPALASSSVFHQQIPDVPRVILAKIRGHVSVAVRVLVDPSGNVVGEFFENAGPSRYFARLAGDAAGAWTFAPTEQRGSRVWLLKFEFTREGATVRALAPQ